MSYEVGSYIKRNNKPMFHIGFYTSGTAKGIASGNEYEIIKKVANSIGYILTIKSARNSTTYDISTSDVMLYFDTIDQLTQQPTFFDNTEIPKIVRKCYCDSLNLFRYGCRCGAVEIQHETLYKEYLNELLGRKE